MFYKILLSIFIALFISACSTTPKDTADSSGAGTSSSDDSSDGGTLTVTDGTGLVPGSQEDLIVNVGDRVFFDYDSAELDEDAQELLQDQVAWIKQHDVSVTIEGHCDERGTREYNLALGERRGNAVKEFLSSLGVDPGRLTVISYGKERPAAEGSTSEAWSENRRAVLVVSGN